MMFHSKVKAATKIQATVRGHQAPKLFHAKVKAATKTQATVRGHQARKPLDKTKTASISRKQSFLPACMCVVS